MINYNDGTSLHGTNLERPRTDVQNTGNLAALNAEVVLTCNGETTFSLDVRGTFVGTFVVEGSVDGTNYTSIGFASSVAGLWVTTLTGVGSWFGGCGAYRQIRCRCSAYTSGTAIVTLRASLGENQIIGVPYPTTLAVTGTAAVNTGVTITIPSGGAGLFHYITGIEIIKFYSVVGVAGSPVVITTTNLPGSLAFTTEQAAGAAGTMVRYWYDFAGNPLKSSVAATNTTIVAPVQLQTIWRLNAFYYVAP